VELLLTNLWLKVFNFLQLQRRRRYYNSQDKERVSS